VIVLRDFEEQMRYQERLSYMAYHDALTGLGNRESFFHRLHSACATAGEPAYGVAACIILDVDHFKEINDAYGHAVGDEVLIQTAARLTEVTRSTDKAFRLGGDEFALVVREMRSRDDLALVVRKVFEAFRAPATIQTVSLPVSISMGYTVIEPSDSAESVYARADAGLYSAKTERGAAIEFTSDQELPQTRRAVLHRRVRDVVQAGSMHWHYQPIVKRDGSVVGAESLARWPQTDEPILSPAEFIPAAEETGLVWTIGTQARADAVGLMGRIAPDDFFISVNLSPRELLDDDLLERLLEQLGPSDAFSRIHLELTETQLMEFGPSQHRLFSALADAGARFLIDDFGTGYSSITRLRSLPVHGVKLDRSFLVDAHTDPRVRSVLEGAIRMVQGLGLELIAEGVESQDQVDFLSEAGCELFQGYYFHRPMTANELCKIVQCGTRPLNGRH
jgi:diguanylate cyclase (GGDEF)-like protein